MAGHFSLQLERAGPSGQTIDDAFASGLDICRRVCIAAGGVIRGAAGQEEVKQLDLALAAGVSARHISFLGSGLAQLFIVDWPRLARHLLARLHRETLQSRGDSRLQALLERTLHFPNVEPIWRQPDLRAGIESTFNVRLRREDITIAFMTTITAFSAPRLVTFEELRIESYFPLDAPTRALCEQLAGTPWPAKPSDVSTKSAWPMSLI